MKAETSPTDRTPTVGVAVIGTGSVARAHIEAMRVLSSTMWPPRVQPRLVALCSRRAEAAAEGAARWGFERWTTEWQELIGDAAVGLIVITTPNNLHAEPSIAALQAGQTVLCEKPLGRSGAESKWTWEAAEQSDAAHATGFNYRFVPALRLAWELIQAGRLGTIYHFRGTYLKGSGMDATAPIKWRHRREIAGLGTIGDLGSHLIDLARWLVGDIETVQGVSRTYIPTRPSEGDTEAVTVDDAAAALIQFRNGAMGTLEATRFAPGHRNDLGFEINGSAGSVRFHLERLNELDVYLEGDAPEVAGFRQVLVTEPTHPYMRYWWPPGHIIGWEHSFVHQMEHVLCAAAGQSDVGPIGATFGDGYRTAVIADAVVESAERGRRISVRDQ